MNIMRMRTMSVSPLDDYVYYTLLFKEHSEIVFENVYSTQLTKINKKSIKGIVELKDGTKHTLVIKFHSDTFVTYSHKLMKGE